MIEAESNTLALSVRTPHGLMFERALTSARIPVATGQVGLRPRMETSILAVESGLMLFRCGETTWFAASAGGLLRTTRVACVVFTPFAVVDSSPEAVLELLAQAVHDPASELEAHHRLEELEQRIIKELRSTDAGIGGLGVNP